MSRNLPHLAVGGIPQCDRGWSSFDTLDGYITPKLYRHWASSCMWLRDDATVIDAFLRSRLSPPYGWGIPQCVRVRMLPPWNIHISVPTKVPTLSMMGILPYVC